MLNLSSHQSTIVLPKREILEECLGIDPSDECHFFSSKYEALFHLYFAIYTDIVREKGKNHFLCSEIEESLKRFEPLGCFARQIPYNHQNQVVKDNLEAAINPRTALVTLPWAQALTGVINPVEELALLCKEKGILLHVDASNIVGKYYFNFKESNIDFVTIEIPQGTTLLIKKKRVPVNIKTHGAYGHIEFSHVIHHLSSQFDYICTETARLRDRFENGIKLGYPEVQVLFENAEKLSTISIMDFHGVAAKALQFALERKGILSALVPHLGPSAMSYALTAETKPSDIESAIDIISNAANKLRTYSYDLIK